MDIVFGKRVADCRNSSLNNKTKIFYQDVFVCANLDEDIYLVIIEVNDKITNYQVKDGLQVWIFETQKYQTVRKARAAALEKIERRVELKKWKTHNNGNYIST